MRKPNIEYFVVSDKCDKCKTFAIHIYKKDCEEKEGKETYIYYVSLCLNCWRGEQEVPAELCKIKKAMWEDFKLSIEN